MCIGIEIYPHLCRVKQQQKHSAMKVTTTRLARLFASCTSYQMVGISPYTGAVTMKFTFSNGSNVKVVTTIEDVEAAENTNA